MEQPLLPICFPDDADCLVNIKQNLLQALKQMEPVGFGGSRWADRKETAPQDPVKESMECHPGVMKPVKPAPKTEPVPEKPDR